MSTPLRITLLTSAKDNSVAVSVLRADMKAGSLDSFISSSLEQALAEILKRYQNGVYAQ